MPLEKKVQLSTPMPIHSAKGVDPERAAAPRLHEDDAEDEGEDGDGGQGLMNDHRRPGCPEPEETER